jgi:hypothetical protein
MFCHTWALKAWNFASRMTVDEYLDRGLRLMLQGVLSPKGLRQMKRLEDAGDKSSSTRSKPRRLRQAAAVA